MFEYKVSFTEIANPRSDSETHDGVLIHIRPPVQLNPDAVERYLTFSDFEPADRSRDWKIWTSKMSSFWAARLIKRLSMLVSIS